MKKFFPLFCKKSLSLLLFPASVFFLFSCTPAYVPNVVNVPLLNNAGETQISLHTGTAGFDPQIALALTDHMAIMVNGSFADRTSDSTDNFHRHAFIEGGTGYYTHLGKYGRFELFGGAGGGRLKALYDNTLWISHSDVRCTRFFLQPALGISTGFFDGSIASRFVLVNLYQGSASASGMFYEPVLTGKLGYRYVKGVFQMGLSLPMNTNEIQFNYQPFIISFGIQADIGRIFND